MTAFAAPGPEAPTAGGTIEPPASVPGPPIASGAAEPATSGWWNGRRRRVALAALALLLVAAVGHWAYRIYDPGPDLALENLAQLQVAHEGWVDVDPSGPAGESVARFFSAAAEARALWPPDLLFE
ncbi:MAG: hypothetical protein KKA32_11040 [Actinobacteria bacterium]|nr:hypothetical protein [Actinomycetota bacterium]